MSYHLISRLKSGWDVVFLVLLLVFVIYASLTAPVYTWGDAPTYYMQIHSIARDHDIQYEPQDIQWYLNNTLGTARSVLFLIKADDGRYFYGKDFTYSLFAAPFYLVFGNNGILLFNALLFYAMVLMGYFFLKKKVGQKGAVYSAVYFLVSILFTYVFALRTDVYNPFLLMLGVFLWLYHAEKPDVRYLAAASLVLGLATVAKAPNAIVFIPFILLELYKKRARNVITAAAIFLVPVLLLYGYFYLETGALTFYGGDRMQYNGNFPFTDTASNVGDQATALGDRATLLSLDSPLYPVYNLAYYFVGRFTGILWYFPLAIFAMLSFPFEGDKKLREHPERPLLFLAIVLYILAYAVLIGDNYFGGIRVIGDRLFYVYPLCLFLVGRVNWKAGLVFLAIGLVTLAPILAAPTAYSIRAGSQTANFPYSYLPVEYSQFHNLPIDGHTVVGSNGQAYTIYDSDPPVSNGALMISGSTAMLIDTSSPLSIRLALSASGNTTARVTSGNFSREYDLNSQGYRLVDLKGMSPEYNTTEYYIYRIAIDYERQG